MMRLSIITQTEEQKDTANKTCPENPDKPVMEKCVFNLNTKWS